MKKVKIICRQSDSGHGTTFECARCGKTLFVNTLCKRTTCVRCGVEFKNVIKIKRTK